MPLYGRDKWDGLYIISQIVCNQCWFYFIWITIHCIIGFIFNINYIPIMDILFDPKVFSRKLYLIYLWAGELILVCIVSSLIVSVVVERSKKCWDYCITIFTLHLFFTTILHSFPYSFQWWLIMGISDIILTMISERICLKHELEDIPVTTL